MNRDTLVRRVSLQPQLNATIAPLIFDSAQPKITYDINLGNYLEFIDIDSNVVTERLRQKGLSDKQISECNIHIDSRQCVSSNGSVVTEGRYNNRSKQAIIYTGCNLGDYRIAKMLTDALAENYDINGFESSIDRTMTKLQEGLGDNIGKTVFHEVEHYFDSVVNTTELNKERRNEIIRFAAPSIGYLGVCIGYGPMVAPHTPLNDTLETAAVQVGLLAAMIGGGIYHNKIGNFKRYRSRSSEVRARLAEEEAPDGFVVFHPKSDFNHPETVPKQSLMKQIIDRASGS